MSSAAPAAGAALLDDGIAAAARRCVADLSARLASHVAASGAVTDRCRSRILETALMLALLDRTGLHPDLRQQLSRFLHDRAGASDLIPLERALAAASLGAGNAGGGVRLEGFDHFSAARKHLMAATYLAVIGGHGWDDPAIDPAVITYRGQASWTEITMCAVKILWACERGLGALIAADRSYLATVLGHGSRRAVWEGHLTAHMLSLLALHRTDPAHPLIRPGVEHLIAQRNPDGGLPFICDMSVFLTALAGAALHEAGAAPDLTRAMGGYLAGVQAPDGGWPYTGDVTQTDVDDTSRTLEFLHALAPARHAETIRGGVGYLTRIAGPDGGFPTYLPGHPPEVTMTANAILALAPHPAALATVREAVNLLLCSQRPNGSYERSWSLSDHYAIHRVTDALHHAPRTALVRHAHDRAARHLAATRNPDGGWGHTAAHPSDAISTSHALLTATSLSRALLRPGIVPHGVIYLLASRDADGGIVSVPDQAAPRPIPYHFPVLADIFALHALARCLQSPQAGSQPAADRHHRHPG